MRQRVSLCVLDLDNTLWDWVEIWYQAFSVKLRKVAEISGIPEDILKAEFKKVHQKYGTTEYPFAIEELPSLQKKHPGDDIRALYDEAMHAYYGARKRAMALYPDVMDVLKTLRVNGCRLVAYTESMAFYTAYRLRFFGLDEVIEILYSPEDHILPSNMKPEDIRKYPAEYYELRKTVHRHTPKGELKPNPDVLLSILRDVGISKENVIYVGDSEMKDIAMANIAGVTSVLAEYGKAQKRPEYTLLREVTHWSDEAVAREKAIAEGKGLSEKDLKPQFTLKSSITELLDLFEFIPADEATHGKRTGSRETEAPTRTAG
jgi:HAD superfamily hydrolase (TIGR01549 family)